MLSPTVLVEQNKDNINQMITQLYVGDRPRDVLQCRYTVKYNTFLIFAHHHT